jgi:prophage antirepressor-like protein
MQNNIQVFEHKDFGIFEVLTIEGKPYFPAVESASILGYAKPHNAVTRHCPHSLKRGVGVETGNRTDGSTATQTVDKIFIPEGDLYRLIIRSKLPAAVRFEKWVFDDVLPSIRNHGSYITSDILEKLLSDPDMAIKYFSMLKAERDKNAGLEAQINAQETKVRYHDLILQCDTPIAISVIAKDYGMTAMAFNKLLSSLRVQYRVGRTWLLHKEHCDLDYTITKTYLIDDHKSAIHTYWTQKGRKFIYDLLKPCGILPQVERKGVA